MVTTVHTAVTKTVSRTHRHEAIDALVHSGETTTLATIEPSVRRRAGASA